MRKLFTCMLALLIGLTVAAQVVERTTDETSKVYSLDEKTSELSVAQFIEVEAQEYTCLAAIPAVADQVAQEMEVEAILEKQAPPNRWYSYIETNYYRSNQNKAKPTAADIRLRNPKTLPEIRRL